MSRQIEKSFTVPQVKICGLTSVNQALGCVKLGASAIGCVFFPKSPRYVTEETAGKICLALPTGIKAVGVFVDEGFSAIMRKVENCRLTAVQLHGRESPELIRNLRKEKLPVIKALFINQSPSINDVADYAADAFIVEYGRGAMPGGNALAWNWNMAAACDRRYSLVLAGGLSPENVTEAILACLPDAVDVSSGVESSPGRKDLRKVKSFISAVARVSDTRDSGSKKLKKIF